jgi:Mur ligase middle domain
LKARPRPHGIPREQVIRDVLLAQQPNKRPASVDELDVCDVGAVLNVTADHLGTKGIETLADLAAVKSIVVESVRRRGHSVLNADDPLTVGMQRHARRQPGFLFPGERWGDAELSAENLLPMAALP